MKNGEATGLSTKGLITAYRWMRSLEQSEQVYLEKRSTQKEIALFGGYCALSNKEFTDDQDFQKSLARYLQLIMILYSMGDEESESIHFQYYGRVPFHLEKISLGLNPYRMDLDYYNLCVQTTKQYKVDKLYDAAADVTHDLENRYSKATEGMMGEVLAYYSYSFFAFILLNGTDTYRFNFQEDFRTYAQYLLKKHYSKPKKLKSKKEELYVKCLRIIAEDSQALKKGA